MWDLFNVLEYDIDSTGRSLSALNREPWILPLFIIACIFITPPIIYFVYAVYNNISLAIMAIPYAPKSSKATSLTMYAPSRINASSFYRYRRYLTIINGIDGWCEFDFKWKYRNLDMMIEITYASMDERPINILFNGDLLGTACEATSRGWGWDNDGKEFVTGVYGPFKPEILDLNTIRLESTAHYFPHLKSVRLVLPKKKVGKRIEVSIMGHLEEEGDSEFPDGHTATSALSGERRLGGFSLHPKFPPGEEVSVSYSVHMSGNMQSGTITQGLFCGNRGSYLMGWRDLQVIRIWLDGADKEKYSIFYRCLVKGGSTTESVWCSGGEECPSTGNTAAITGLSVLIEEKGAGNLALIDHSRDIETGHEGYITENIATKAVIKNSRSIAKLETTHIKYATTREDEYRHDSSQFLVYTTLLSKFEDGGEERACALGAFSAKARFPDTHSVSVHYSAVMRGGQRTGVMREGEFCGNKTAFEYGWKDLVVMRMWLEGADSEKYSIFYRCLLRGKPTVSGWSMDAEVCPSKENSSAIIGVAVVVADSSVRREDIDQKCEECGEAWVACIGAMVVGTFSNPSVGALGDKKSSSCVSVKRSATSSEKKAKRKVVRGVSSRVAPVEPQSSSPVNDVPPLDCSAKFTARLEYIKQLLKTDVMSKTLVKRNIDALYSGRPYMIPLSVSAFIDIEGEVVVRDGAMAMSKCAQNRLNAFLLRPVFPPGERVVMKSSALMHGGLRSEVVRHGMKCGNTTDHALGWRDLHVIRIWLDGPDSDKYTVYYRCQLRGALSVSQWCSNGEECPRAGNTSHVIVGICVIVEENTPLQVPPERMRETGREGLGTTDYARLAGVADIPSPNIYPASVLPKLDLSPELSDAMHMTKRKKGAVSLSVNADDLKDVSLSSQLKDLKSVVEDLKRQLQDGTISKKEYVAEVEKALEQRKTKNVA